MKLEFDLETEKSMIDIIREKARKASRINKKYEVIVKILEDDKCFEKMDVSTSISILNNLGFNNYQAEKIYLQLIRRRQSENNYIFMTMCLELSERNVWLI